MSGLQSLKVFINQRLTAAAHEIFAHVERTITEYEEQMDRRHREQLEEVLTPEMNLWRETVFPADDRQLLMREEVRPEQQEWSSGLVREDPEPPHIKEEQQDFWTRLEGEQLRDPDITEFPSTSVPVKSEGDEEKPQSSQMETEADGEDCGGPEPDRNSDPVTYFQPDSDSVDSDFWKETRKRPSGIGTRATSEPDTDDSDDWKKTREPQSGVKSVKNEGAPVGESRCRTVTVKNIVSSARKKSFSCVMCGKRFSTKGDLRRHVRSHTGERPFSCSVCRKSFTQSGNLHRHMILHTIREPFRCSVVCSLCEQKFTSIYKLRNHNCVVRQSASANPS